MPRRKHPLPLRPETRRYTFSTAAGWRVTFEARDRMEARRKLESGIETGNAVATHPNGETCGLSGFSEADFINLALEA